MGLERKEEVQLAAQQSYGTKFLANAESPPKKIKQNPQQPARQIEGIQ
jgi:hypothetical protein